MEISKYELSVAYRIYPKVSKTPPVFTDDKFKLSELCLKSFINSLGSLKVKFWIILDNCPDEYEALFKKYIDEDNLELIKLPGVGNSETFGKQIDILKEQSDTEFIYFAEDDYFYIENQFSEIIEFMKKNNDVHFVSPYNHPDYYEYHIHNYKYDSKEFLNRNWRTGATTCMTFLTTKSILTETEETFRTYTRKNYDTSLWLSLTKYKLFNPLNLIKYLFTDKRMFKVFVKGWIYNRKQLISGKKWKLWVPVPSIATHMDNKHLAPSIDWYNLFGKI
ncbi:MAG: glycosyltransferase family 2 protein [Ignavibacteriae bacterium]|nr:glycosyltransferase family 2 protein [Ignavibacteriota bacterium]